MRLDLTEIIFLLDRSGSMSGLKDDTIGGFNGFMEKQSKLPGETKVTAVLFDDKCDILWSGKDAREAHLTDKDYYVRGSTALLDAVGKTIFDVGIRLANTKPDERPGKVIFVITTDGMENASREFTQEKVKELITHQQENYNWEFIFMGANIDAAKEADNIGIKKSDAYSYKASQAGVHHMYSMACEEVTKKRRR